MSARAWQFLGAVAVITVFVVLAYFAGDRFGYQRAVTDYSTQAAKAATKAKNEQARLQGEVLNATDRAREAQDREAQRVSELAGLRRRVQQTPRCSDGGGSDPYVAGIVRLHNATANSPDLPKSTYTREVDEAEATAAIVSDSASDYIQCAIDYNALVDLVAGLECVAKAN